jgi:glucans biosynthesis protein
MRRLAVAATIALMQLCMRSALAFGLEDVAAQAKALAEQPFRGAAEPADPRVRRLNYNEWRMIRFRAERALWRGDGLGYEVQWLHAGANHAHPVRLNEIVQGNARPIAPGAGSFDYGRAFADDEWPRVPDVAGFRVVLPMTGTTGRELIAFLGSSYFRAPGPGQYGLSARGIAIDTVAQGPEEFPRFVAYWLERPTAGADELTIYALLDGARTTGAYRFVVRPGNETVVDVQARIFLRSRVEMFGIAPLTSMYLSGENQPRSGGFRPEVHDSDGLQIATPDGEWIWRPLVNPRGVLVRRFAYARPPLGFGLMQRDRAFTSYEDTEARYQKRPSAWVEPIAGFAAGRIELMAFETGDEYNDNVAAYWVPDVSPRPMEPFDAAWRIRWQGDAMQKPPLAWTLQTRWGHGGAQLKPGEQQFVVDFVGGRLDQLPPNARVRGLVQVTGGPGRVEAVNAFRNPDIGGWRMSIRLVRGDPNEPVELQGALVLDGELLSETWSYVLPPDGRRNASSAALSSE